MTGERRSERAAGDPMIYQIRLQGYLSQLWMDWFDGLTITLEEDGNTLLRGPVVDQSALHGILKKIRDLGMPLLSVHSVPSDGNETPDVKIQPLSDS
jgi:hypothetical protein